MPTKEINEGIQDAGKELGTEELPPEAVAGIAVGATVVAGCLLFALYYCCTRRRRREKRKQNIAASLDAWSTANTLKASESAATKIQSFVRGKKARIEAAEKRRGKKKKSGAGARAMRIDTNLKGTIVKKDKKKKKKKDGDKKGRKKDKRKKRGDALARAAKKKQRAINARKKRAHTCAYDDIRTPDTTCTRSCYTRPSW